MIDTDKYEGHTKGKWDVTMDDTMEGYYFFRQGYDREQEEDCDYDECRANARLMSDAPLFLAEIKRLRRELRKAKHWVKDYFIDKNGDYKDVGDKISYYDFMREVERIE
tara:strand:- start:372 stop:698 length:327 start_codon:yes stop_codon:yes gene_type:complete